MAPSPSHAITPGKNSGASKLLNDYVSSQSFSPQRVVDVYPPSNSGTPLAKARSVRYTVSSFSYTTNNDRSIVNVGALNWATGETVAVKEIQLSNIPKGELGQIMVLFFFGWLLLPFSSSFPVVGDRLAQESQRMVPFARVTSQS